MEWLAPAVQILVGIGGLAGLVSLFTVSAQRRRIVAESGKTNAEADAAFSEAYHRRVSTQVSMIEPYEKIQTRMQKEIDSQAKKIEEQDKKIDSLEQYVEVLVQTMRDAGLAVPPNAHPGGGGS